MCSIVQSVMIAIASYLTMTWLLSVQHRKIAVSFRDLSLFKVFQVALVALRQMLDSNADTKLKEQVSCRLAVVKPMCRMGHGMYACLLIIHTMQQQLYMPGSDLDIL